MNRKYPVKVELSTHPRIAEPCRHVYRHAFHPTSPDGRVLRLATIPRAVWLAACQRQRERRLSREREQREERRWRLRLVIKPTCRCRPPGARLLGTWTLRFWPRHGPVRSLSCSRKLDMPSFPDRLHVQMGCARGGKSSDEELDVEYQRKGPRGCSTVHRVGMDDFTELKSSA